jgi:hypothetical protein
MIDDMVSALYDDAVFEKGAAFSYSTPLYMLSDDDDLGATWDSCLYRKATPTKR